MSIYFYKVKLASCLTISFIVIILFFTQFVSADNSIVICKQVDPWEKVFRESSVFHEFNKPAEVAKGECATYQFVVYSKSENLTDIRVHIDTLEDKRGHRLSSFEWGFVGYVGVNHLAQSPADDSYLPNSHKLPDPIIEVPTMNAPKGTPLAVVISVAVPENAQDGLYSSSVTISYSVNKKLTKVKKIIQLRVYPIKLIPTNYGVANQCSFDSWKKSYDKGWNIVAPYSSEWYKSIEETCRKLKSCNTNCILISPIEFTHITKHGQTYQFDFQVFDSLLSICQRHGVLKYLEGGHLAKRSKGWESNFLVCMPKISNTNEPESYLPITNRSVKDFYFQFLPVLSRHIAQKFPHVIYYQHVADEPIDANAASYLQILNTFKSFCPKMKFMDACLTTLIGDQLDLNVPMLSFYHQHYFYYRRLQNIGKPVWFYTCWIPQFNYANRFIELPLLKVRIIHWLCFKYGAKGYLHWGFNRWVGNPYTETTQREGNSILPGGDSWIVYPSKSGKIFGSLRLLAMRDGINDYYLLEMLYKKDPKMATRICNRIVYDWTLYNLNTNYFYKVRHLLLQTLIKEMYNC